MADQFQNGYEPYNGQPQSTPQAQPQTQTQQYNAPQFPPQYTQPQYTQPPYQQPYADKTREVMSIGSYLGVFFISMIPVVNFIMLIVWLVSSNTNKNKKNYLIASIIFSVIIGVVYGILFAILMAAGVFANSEVFNEIFNSCIALF